MESEEDERGRTELTPYPKELEELPSWWPLSSHWSPGDVFSLFSLNLGVEATGRGNACCVGAQDLRSPRGARTFPAHTQASSQSAKGPQHPPHRKHGTLEVYSYIMNIYFFLLKNVQKIK